MGHFVKVLAKISILLVILGFLALTTNDAYCDYVTEVVEGYYAEAPNGSDLYVKVVRPQRLLYANHRFPCIIYVPDSLNAGVDLMSLIASEGYIEVFYNPEGRGSANPSQGVENYHGTNHQDDLKAMIEYIHEYTQCWHNNVMIAAYGDGMAAAAGCLSRHPDLEVKCLIDIEGSSGSYTTLGDPWLLDSDPANDCTDDYYAMYGHYSTTMDTTQANRTWWANREALNFIDGVRSRYLRLQAEWDCRQPPNASYPSFYYPPDWYQGKHAVDLCNAACGGCCPWVRINLNDLGNSVGQTYDSLSLPTYYTGTLDTSHIKAAIREMAAMDPISPDVPEVWATDMDEANLLWWENDELFTIDYWEVYRTIYGSVTPLTLVDTVTDSFYLDTDVDNGVTYWYRIRATNTQGYTGGYSVSIYLRPHPPDLYLPMLVQDCDRLENGNTLVTDGGFIGPGTSGGVFEITPEGECVWHMQGSVKAAHNGDLLPCHSVIISDTKNDRVVIMDSLGNITWNTDDLTLSDGSHLNYPNDANMIEPGGTRLITDRDNHRIFEIDAVGNVVWQFGVTGVPGCDDTHIRAPHNGDRLPNGNTIFSDSENNRILEVTPDGQIVWQYSTGLSWPRDGDRLDNGNTLIVDTHHNRIVEVDSLGSLVWEFSEGIQIPYDADRLDNGNTLISTRNELFEVTPAGVRVWQYPFEGLTTPQNLTIFLNGVNVELDWKMVVNATRYYIYTDDEPIMSILGLTPIGNSTVTYYTVPDAAQSAMKKFYAVVAWNSQ